MASLDGTLSLTALAKTRRSVHPNLERLRGDVDRLAHFLQQLDLLLRTQLLERFVDDDGDDGVRFARVADVRPSLLVVRVDHFQRVRRGSIDPFSGYRAEKKIDSLV